METILFSPNVATILNHEWPPFSTVKNHLNQPFLHIFDDATLGPLYDGNVKGHILKTRVILDKLVRYTENVKLVSFEELSPILLIESKPLVQFENLVALVMSKVTY